MEPDRLAAQRRGESMSDKPVDFRKLDSPIRKCCGAVTGYVAVRSVRATKDGGCELGYTLESQGCDCAPRWVAHNWRKADAQFVTLPAAS